MNRLAYLASSLLLAADLMVAAVPSSQASDQDTETITITTSASTVVLGKRVTVSGSGPWPRTIMLQMKTAENDWQTVARSVTDLLTGQYSFTAPGWYGTHRLRVVVPGTLIFSPVVSDVRTVRVKMGYRLRGERSDWSWLGRSGARWEPCRTITYRVDARGTYDRATADVKAAARSVARITGLRLKYLGTTTREVVRRKRGYHPADTDIVVDWQTPRQDRGLAGGVAGIGGHWVQDRRLFDGYVVLDRTERMGRGTWRQVMRHEVGHVLGLGHARASSQVMFGTASRKNARFGAGDLAGMSRVGASRGCLPPGSSRRSLPPDRHDSAQVSFIVEAPIAGH